MSKVLQSKATAWGAFLLIVIMLVLTFSLRWAWWAFFDLFFFFMMVFCHLVAVYIQSYSRMASSKLEIAAFVCGILGILSLIGEYTAWQMSV